MKTGSQDAERKLSRLGVDDDEPALSNLADYVRDTGGWDGHFNCATFYTCFIK